TGSGFHLQGLPSQSAVYDHSPGASRLSSCGRGVSRAGAYLSADSRVPESAAQTPSVGGAVVCRSQTLARLAPLPLAFARAASIVKPCASRLDKTSSDSSRNEAGDAARSQ